jgi:hypothetical protein
MSEAKLQRAVAKLLDDLGWLYCHVPNEGKRKPSTGNRLKLQGMKRGVPDIIIFEAWSFPAGDAAFSGHTIAIELKVKGGLVRPEQKQWLDALKERGALTAVCRSMDEVLTVLRHVRPLNGHRIT